MNWNFLKTKCQIIFQRRETDKKLYPLQMRHLRIIIVSNETLRLTFRCKIVCSYFQTDGLPQPVTMRPGQSRHLSLKAQSLCGNGYRLPSQPVMSFISYTEIPYYNITDQVPHSYFFLQIFFFIFLFTINVMGNMISLMISCSVFHHLSHTI